MAWARIDDQMPNKAKVRHVGPLGLALHVAAICYASRDLTDGFVPDAVVPSLLDLPARQLKALLPLMTIPAQRQENPLWHRVEGGYEIHDYLEYNPNRASVLAEREKAKARMNAVRSGNVRANKARTSSNPDPRPDPQPLPLGGERENARGAAAIRPGLERDPDEAPFALEYIRRYEQRNAAPPSPIEKAEARRLERDFGTEIARQVAVDYEWQKKPQYLRSILEERRNGNANGANRGKPAEAIGAGAMAAGISDMERRRAAVAERRRASES